MDKKNLQKDSLIDIIGAMLFMIVTLGGMIYGGFMMS